MLSMQLRSEGSSVRFVAISLLIFTAASFIGYWYWSPYYAADQIKNAIESGDTARMSKFIDFPKVRLNIQRQINNQIDLKLREFQSQPVTTKNQIDLYSFQLVDRLVRDLVTEEGIAALISGKNKLTRDSSLNPNDGFKNVHLQAKVADKGMLGVDVEKKYGDSVNRFYVTLSGKNRPDDKVLITLSREGFFFWRVTNVLLPFGT
ncbi:DUF2939 domain-containing protein [Parasutterella excrementihominis]|uniref:DUF2939 domain-containing protein n=2 Tax=Parasutterella excrementihominis TaxID=487175 RepID=UPI0025B2416D|nr:DUF2939 domain-containing protein [Parasutterella excrementihominis]